MPHAFNLRLDAGPLLCDGAMGTMLYARGVSLDACFDVLNLNNPRLVQAIHADYIAAGADLIETNTLAPIASSSRCTGSRARCGRSTAGACVSPAARAGRPGATSSAPGPSGPPARTR